MKKLSLITMSLLFVSACSVIEDRLYLPSLQVSAHQDGAPTYAESYVQALPSADGDSVEEIVVIDLGSVPLWGRSTAMFELTNESAVDLRIDGLRLEGQSGAGWELPFMVGEAVRSYADGYVIPAWNVGILGVTVAPSEIGAMATDVVIQSNASNGVTRRVRVLASAEEYGAPRIEVAYNGFTGPNAAECVDVEGDGIIEGCVMSQPLDFGGIGLGASATARVTIRNDAACAPYPGGDGCSHCTLRVTAVMIEEDDDGRFGFAGSSATPFDLPQCDASCGQSGELQLGVTFQAPNTIAEFRAKLVIRAHTPNAPRIDIPMRARSVN